MRIVITGATGFIGGHIARRLLARGDELVAIVRDPNRASDLAHLGAELVEGNLIDKASMRPAFAGANALFHVAAWYEFGVDATSRMERINVEGTRNVLELMRENGLEKGVYTSTVTVFSDTDGRLVDETYRHDPTYGFLSSYDRTKWKAHYDVALPLIEQGLPLVIVQPGVVYGPGDTSQMGDTLRQYLRGDLPLVVRGTAYCWGHVEDIANAHLSALEDGTIGETYIIAGPPHTLEEALELAEQWTGIPAPRLRPSPRLVRALAATLRPVHALVGLQGLFHPEMLRVVAGVTYYGDDSKARAELGFAPRTLEEGLPPTLAAELQRMGRDVPKRLAKVVTTDSPETNRREANLSHHDVGSGTGQLYCGDAPLKHPRRADVTHRHQRTAAAELQMRALLLHEAHPFPGARPANTEPIGATLWTQA